MPGEKKIKKIDPKLVEEGIEEFGLRKPITEGDSISITNMMRKSGIDEESKTNARIKFYQKYGKKGGLLSLKEKLAKARAEMKAKKDAIKKKVIKNGS